MVGFIPDICVAVREFPNALQAVLGQALAVVRALSMVIATKTARAIASDGNSDRQQEQEQ